jgi:hypothetical protein
MRSIEKFIMAKSAEGALFSISLEHPLSKGPLMKPLSHQSRVLVETSKL